MGTLYTVDGTTGSITTAGSITSTSTTSGFLPPKLTTTQRNAIVSPATGLEIFNTTTNQPEYYNGTSWVGATATSPAGSSGQVQFNSSGIFGATASLFWDISNSRLGINNASPTVALDVGGSARLSGSLEVDGAQITLPTAGSSQITLFCASGGSFGIASTGRGGSVWDVLYDPFTSGTRDILAYSVPVNKAHIGVPLLIQNNIINQEVPVASALLQLVSTTQGFLAPSMTTTQRNAISSPATGLEIFNTTTSATEVWSGVRWNSFGSTIDIGDATTSTTLQNNPTTTVLSNSGVRRFLIESSSSIELQAGSGLNGLFNVNTGVSASTKVGLGTATPDASAALDITSTVTGFLPPRMTTTQRNAISSPATGLEVFNTTTNQPEVYNGTSWVSMVGNSASGVSGAMQFSSGTGTFSSDDAKLHWDDSNFRLGIGTNIPSYPLHAIISNSSLTVANSILTLENDGTGTAWLNMIGNSGGSSSQIGWDGGSFTWQVGAGSGELRWVGGTNNFRIDCNNMVINALQSGGTTLTMFGNILPGSTNSFALGITGATWTGVAVQSLGVSWVGTSAPATPGAGNSRIYANSTTNTLLASQNNLAYVPVVISNLVSKTTTYTVLPTDYTVLGDATSASFVATLPSVSQNTGRIFVIKKTDSSANTVTVTPASGTIDGASTFVLTSQYQSITIQSDGTNWWIL